MHVTNNKIYYIDKLLKNKTLIKKFLPPKFYTHIDRETLENVFTYNDISEIEEYVNMGLSDLNLFYKTDKNKAVRLGFNEIEHIKKLIEYSYPEAWLDDELIKLNKNFGIYEHEKLISFAGIHAYSEEYEVAAVAHVTTHPNYRKNGYAEEVVAALSKELRNKIKHVGLNVKVENFSAIKCYKKLGFQEFGKFIACEISNK